MIKKILKVIGFIIFLFGLLVVIVMIIDMRQERKFQKEIAAVHELLEQENADMDRVNKKLEQIVTDSEYGQVEKAVKAYMMEVLNTYACMEEAWNDPAIYHALTAENYQSDGPEFTDTEQKLENLKSTLVVTRETMKSMMKEKTVMSYLAEGIDSYYADLYREVMGKEKILVERIRESEKKADEVLQIISIEEEILELLSSNKDGWKIQDGVLAFSDSKLEEDYKQMILILQYVQ